MKDRARSIKVEVADNNSTRGGHILHEQEYNTGHGISAIPDKIRGEIRREPSQPKIQQEPVLYLLLENPLGWNGAVSVLLVQTSPQPSQPAYRGRVEADPGYAPPQPQHGYGGTVAPSAQAGLYPTPGEPVPGDAEIRAVSRS